MVGSCGKYRAGQMRTACEFQRKTRTDDGAGGWSESWTAIAGAPTRCAFTSLSGSERMQAQRIEAPTRNRVACRYFAGLAEGDRIVIAGRAYEITFINNLEMRNRWYEIDVSGGVAT